MNSLERYIADLEPFIWLNANAVNGFDTLQPNQDDDILVWKNLSGLSDFGKTTGRSNRSPKYVINEDGLGNNADLFTRGNSSTEVDTDLLTLENNISKGNPITFAIVAKPRSNSDLSNVVGSSYGVGYHYSHYNLDGNSRLVNTFRQNQYMNSKFMVITSYTDEGSFIKVGDGEVLKTDIVTQNNAQGFKFVGGRGYDGDQWTGNFATFNARNYDGWIYEVIVIDLPLFEFEHIDKLKRLQSYYKLKYNI